MYEITGLPSRPPPPPPASLVDVSAYTRQSRTYEPDDPELRRKRVRRFRLDELQRFPREVYDVHRAIQKIFPEAAFERGFLGRVRNVLTEYTEMNVDLWFESIRVIRRNHLRGLIPGTTLIAVIGLAPLSEKILIELDLRFVYRVIDRLLGGHGIAVDVQRPLTEIEQGVLSFVALKVMMLFQTEVVNPEQVAIRLEDMRNDIRSTADILRHEDTWICAAWKMNYDLDVGYVRALIPRSLTKQITDDRPPPDSPVARRTRERIRSRMNRLGDATVDASIAVGEIALTRPEMEGLDPGDIVVLENAQVQLTEAGVAGPATMTIGLGKNATIHGIVGAAEVAGEYQLVFQVEQFEHKQTPTEHDPSMAHGAVANPENVVAEYEDPQEEAHEVEDEDYEEEYDEAEDGTATADDILDEDYGIDDENAGEEEEYDEGEGYEEGYEGEYEEQEGGGEAQGYEEAIEEDVPIDDDDKLAEAQPLLGDIPMIMVVELGRVQLTADEVIRLRGGQLIELGRSPADPVDLVVNGKLLAKGELVEIEGQLGVKILNLVEEHLE